MKEISALIVLACGLVAFAIALVLYGLAKPSRRPLYAAGATLALAVLLAGWAAYRTLSKGYRHVAEAIRPRNGVEIYGALFGRSPLSCIQVLAAQDQVIPKIDYAIWLHYRTCPQELKRVLGQHPYVREVVGTASLLPMVPNGEAVAWFRPKLLGDTVIVYEYTALNGRNSRRFWTSPDSTNVFYQDILD
jgi:hypothetical protein